MKSDKIKAIVYGVGSLGERVSKYILQTECMDIVGAIDLQHVGKDLASVVEVESDRCVRITDDAAATLSNADADVVIHMTTSNLERVVPQLVECAMAGLNVVSSCEELSYPYRHHGDLANQLDRAFKAHGVTLLGTGINPGFLMDKLPLVLSGIMLNVRKVKVTRVICSQVRRPSFQRKIGTGLERDEFLRLIHKKAITGHVGLVESVAMIVDGLSLNVDDIRARSVEPVICQREVVTYTDPSRQEVFLTVKPGQVAGLRNIAEAIVGGEAAVTLEFVAHANVEEAYDLIEIDGTPTINVKILDGVDGDIGTAAILVNSVQRVLDGAPGLIDMKDINMPVPFGCG